MKHPILLTVSVTILLGVLGPKDLIAQRVALGSDPRSDVLFAYSGSDKRTLVIISGPRNSNGVLGKANRVTLFSKRKSTGLVIDFNARGLPVRITGSDGSSIALKPIANGRFFRAKFYNPKGKQVGSTVRFAAASGQRSRNENSSFKLPSIGSALRSIPRRVAGVSDSELSTLFGQNLGGEISGMLDLFGETVEKIVTRVAKVGASVRSPITAARQIGEDFFEDVLGEMASNDATGRIQVALDVRDLVNNTPPNANQISRLSKYAKTLVGILNSADLRLTDLPASSDEPETGAGFISFRAFFPRPDGIEAADWQEAGSLVQQQFASQGVNLGSLAPIVNIQFLSSGLLANYNRLPADDVNEARRTVIQLYGNPPWQLTGPTIETR